MEYLRKYKTLESNENSIEFSLFDKFAELHMDFNELIRFLKLELNGNVVEFTTEEGIFIERKINNVIVSNGEIVFLCGDTFYSVDNHHKIVCYKEKKIEDDEYFWIVGVPSGEAIRVNRYREFKELLDKGLLFFEYKYDPTFYGFEDKDRKKIKEIIDWSSLKNLIDGIRND